jgi:quercetin dioxygenase-like cupin family protein
MFTKTTLLIAAVVTLAACGGDSSTSAGPKSAEAAEITATRGSEQDLQWGPAPPVFPPGAQMAVLQGDPSKAELFTVRLKFPNGYKIAPHTHPTAENVTVLTGTFLAGMGTQFKTEDLKAFGKDAFASIPAEHAHYAMARGLTIVQVHAIGPFALTYVNPADNPVANR